MVAETRQAAKDAAEKLVIDGEELPAVATVTDAAAPGAQLVHDEVPGNQCYDWHIGDKDAVEAAKGMLESNLAALTNARLNVQRDRELIAAQAITRFGILRGLVLAAWRLLRCNPWSHGGFDPVDAQRLFKPRVSAPSAG